jgi:hypothetical protein
MQEFVLFDENGNDVCQVTIEKEEGIANCDFEGSNMGLAGLMLTEIYESDLTRAEPGSYSVDGTIYTIKKY